MTDKPKLHLIQGTLAPDTPAEKVRKRVRAMPKPPTMVQCHRCGGREVIETRIGMLMKNGKPTGGTKKMICVGCLLRGERVVIG
ncbi:hypothetical protein [Pseudomonas fragi]|uniref:hypothetical protein n=1 Tax=Pseudomonas fragi TaxID=296 RepID=UPI000BA27ABB|nr:hypothetical protein [Pseudomonas fragi]PAA14394.1 hypothetical protein CJU74_14875 [Pseudomonas fragi]